MGFWVHDWGKENRQDKSCNALSSPDWSHGVFRVFLINFSRSRFVRLTYPHSLHSWELKWGTASWTRTPGLSDKILTFCFKEPQAASAMALFSPDLADWPLRQILSVFILLLFAACHHALNIQILKHNQVKLLDQAISYLPLVILSSISNFLFQSC